MANTPPENPPSTPAKAPSDTLLKNFRATIESKWKKFDDAVPSIAKNISDDYKKAKSEYEKSITILSGLQDDNELQSNKDVQKQLDTTLEVLNNHLMKLSAAEKSKDYNIALQEMRDSLANLKGEIIGNRGTSQTASTETTPVIATAVGTAALGASGEVGKALDEAKSEITDGIKKELGPWAMIFGGVKDVPAKEVADQLKGIAKEYSEKKWMTDPLDKLTSMIKLFFLKWQIGRAKLDLSAHMTPEEMKLAGLDLKKGSVTNQQEKRNETPANTALIRISYKGFVRTFIQPVVDNSGKKKVYSYEDMDRLITVDKFKDAPFQKILDLHAKYRNSADKKGILLDLGISDTKFDPEMIVYVIENIVVGKGRAYIDKHANMPQSQNLTVGDVFSKLHKNMYLGEKFSTLKPNKPITGPTDIGVFLGEIASKLDMPLQDTVSLMNHADYASSLKDLGISSSMLGYIISNQSSNIHNITQTTVSEADISDEGGKESLKKVLDFWEKFQNTISEKFSFGKPIEFKEYLKKNGATLGDVFRLYVVTGGDPSYEALNASQQAYIYMKLWGILGKDNNFRGEYFNKPLISAFFNTGSQIFIPQDVKNIIGTLFNSAIETSLDKMGGFITEVWASLDTKQKTIFITSVGAGIALLWYLKPLRWIGMGIAGTVIAGSIGTAIAAVWPNQKTIKINNKEYTPEQVKDNIVQEVSKISQ